MNTFGNTFRVSIFGESHTEGTGVVIDGVPSGLELNESDLTEDLSRRKSGAKGTTSRREPDVPHIISGVYNGYTTGAPVTVFFRNDDVQSGSYDKYASIPRPGQTDFSASERFGGWNDPRGGGHLSGRLTVGIVAAGCIARKILSGIDTGETPVGISADIVQLGGCADKTRWDRMLEDAQNDGDSLGAVVECRADVPSGIGEPFWNSVESVISHTVFAIPGVRGIEFGDGFKAAGMRGSEHNDPFGTDGKPAKNGSGGVNGGITNGAPIIFRVAFKPTSSISRQQRTLNFETGEIDNLSCDGRHDVCFALRTPVIVEAMCAIALADLVL